MTRVRVLLAIVGVVGLALLVAAPASAQCAKIKDGTIIASDGSLVTLGYDQWGYNYQAHMFNGLYANYTRPVPPVTEGTENLIMKWSDDWLSNQDCDGDGKLDRGGSTGISQGWLTNHIEGDYLGADGDFHHYTYFVKIVYVGPALSPDPWEGKRIWGAYAIIEEVNNDPYGGFHGVNRESLVNPAGLGFWTK